MRRLHPLNEERCPSCPHLVARLKHGRKRRVRQLRHFNIIEANDRNVLRASQSGIPQRGEHSQRDQVVAANYCGGLRPLLQQRQGARFAVLPTIQQQARRPAKSRYLGVSDR